MNAMRVWVRPVDDECRVRVDGIENARRLLDLLSQSFIFKSSEPIRQEPGSSLCTFQVTYNPPSSRSKFERLLARTPEVTLMAEPA
jgi:hypothetical protein